MPSRKNLWHASLATCPDAPRPANAIWRAEAIACAASSIGIDDSCARISIIDWIEASITFIAASEIESSGLTSRCT